MHLQSKLRCYQPCTRGHCELCGDERAMSGYLRPWGATTGQIMAGGGSRGPRPGLDAGGGEGVTYGRASRGINEPDCYVLTWQRAATGCTAITREKHIARFSHDTPAGQHPAPRFYLPAGCWRAQTAQHSQLTRNSHIRRACRPGATRRPGAGPFPH